MTDEKLRQLATKELVAYVKGEASAMCPASKDYWKKHIEETLNGIAELESIITNHEFYQNGYKAAEKDCRVKFGKELYEKDNAIEIRDFRIKELEKEKCELLGIIQGKDKAIARLQKELADAKEIIKGLLSLKSTVSNAQDVKNRFSVREKVEGFLKEEL